MTTSARWWKSVLRKTQSARVALGERFANPSGELTELGRVDQPQRNYPAPNADNFATVLSLSALDRDRHPRCGQGHRPGCQPGRGAHRRQPHHDRRRSGALIETSGILAANVGRLVSLADLYEQLASDVPIETKTDLNRLQESTPDATRQTVRVARGLYLLGQANYIPTTDANVARAVADDQDANFADPAP